MMQFCSPTWRQQVSNQLEQILRTQEKIMAEVQLDDSVLTSTAAAIEQLVTADNALVAAVTAFLASPAVAPIPEADLAATGITQALADAGTANTNAVAAQAALQAATPTPPAGS